MLDSQSLKDFLSLFYANISQKALGLIRELIIAFLLGSSILYANFLLLRVVADLFSQFTAGNSLKSNLLPKFTRFYNKYEKVSLVSLFRYSKRVTIFLFLISQIIQTIVIFYLGLSNSYVFYLISVILSFSISFSFINTIFLTIIQARGDFLKYSYSAVSQSFIVSFLIYPLISFFSIIGLAISRLFGILSVTFAFIYPLTKEKEGSEISIINSDFNFATIILGNFANIILISSRSVAGLDGSNSITYFMYAVVILNILLTSVITNVSTILLRQVSIKKNNLLLWVSLALSLFVGILMVFFFKSYSSDIIRFIYYRGAFNLIDVAKTSEYLYELSFPYLFIFLATILFQPFLSLSISKTKSIRLLIAKVFLLSIISSIGYVLINDFSVERGVLIVMYVSSITSFILGVLSYKYYINNCK